MTSTLQEDEDDDGGPITIEIVSVIRAMSEELKMSKAAIGRRFGIPRETVRDIVNRKSWKDLN